MKLLITGSRHCEAYDYQFLLEAIKTHCGDQVTKILHGDALGADQLAHEYAKTHNIEIEIIRPDYAKYDGKRAPIIRNIELVDKADAVIAMYKYEVKGGTAFTASYAEKQGKLIACCYLDFPPNFQIPQTTYVQKKI